MKVFFFAVRKWQSLLLMVSRIVLTNRLRCFVYSLAGVEIGKGTVIARDAIIKRGVKLGNNVEIRSESFLQFVSIGDNTVIDKGTLLVGVGNKKFSIGNESYIGYYNIIDGSGGLEIGDYVHIASPGVGIWTHSSMLQALFGSKMGDQTHRKEGYVKIGNNIWIGGNTTIYPNTQISDFSVVFPNSVVNKNVPPNSLVGGTPIKVLKKIVIEKDNIIFVEANE